VHADAVTAAETDWAQVVTLYDQLLALRPTPVVALNRAVAIGELEGAPAVLAALDELDAGALADYQPFHAVRADLLARTGRTDEALDAYDRAIDLSVNPTERAFLDRQRALTASL
jgi:RNA polymerase sigma-70 factor (ECF subfamily)